MAGEPDFQSEWSAIERLRAIKRKFPLLTTTASAKWLIEAEVKEYSEGLSAE
jgi:hypothetical protein